MATAEAGGDAEELDYETSSLLSLTTGVKYEDPRFHLNLVQKVTVYRLFVLKIPMMKSPSVTQK